MTGFIVRRVLSSLLVVVLTSIFVFVLFFKGLGDTPAINYCDSIHNGRCSPAALGHGCNDAIEQVATIG